MKNPRKTLALLTLCVMVAGCGTTSSVPNAGTPNTNKEKINNLKAMQQLDFWNFVKDDPEFHKIAEQLNIDGPEDLEESMLYVSSPDGKIKKMSLSDSLLSGQQVLFPGNFYVYEDISAADVYLHLKAKPMISCFESSPYNSSNSVIYDGKFISPNDQFGNHQVIGRIQGTKAQANAVVSPGYVQFYNSGAFPRYTKDGDYSVLYNLKGSCGGYRGWAYASSLYEIIDTPAAGGYWDDLAIRKLKSSMPLEQGGY